MARLLGVIATLWASLALLVTRVYMQEDDTLEIPTGRLDAFDEILEENLVVLLQEGADLQPVIDALNEEKKLMKEDETSTPHERKFADYYIDIVTRIYLHGSPKLLGKEQEYLEEQAQGAGEEAVYAEYYLAILEGIRNMAQEHIARVLNQPEPTFEKDEL